MKRTLHAVVLSGLLPFGFAGTVSAHHSFAAAYDLDDPVTVERAPVIYPHNNTAIVFQVGDFDVSGEW